MLTKEILCAYLPYNVEIASPKMKNGIRSIMILRPRHLNDDGTLGDSLYKPLLHPLSSLTKPITHNGETFVPIDVLGWNSYEHIIKSGDCTSVSYLYVKKLLEWHFDIFGLIKSGHAIELKEEK